MITYTILLMDDTMKITGRTDNFNAIEWKNLKILLEVFNDYQDL